MIKKDIYRLEDILSKGKTPFLKSIRNVSVTLYHEACLQENSNELCERILFLFADERGAYKRTYAKRFEKFDAEVLAVLSEEFSSSTPLSLHDVGVSDGRTSVDLFSKLSTVYTGIDFTASDYNPFVEIIEKGKLKVTIKDSGEILEILYPPFVFVKNNYLYILLYPLNFLIRKILERFMVQPLMREYQNKKIKSKKLFLFAPAATKLESLNKNFHLKQHDILNNFTKKYDVIRAMNVLNPSYFQEKDFLKILRNIHNALNPDGIFITGSNQNANTTVNGGVYKKTPDSFEPLWESGQGSPIAQHIFNKHSAPQI